VSTNLGWIGEKARKEPGLVFTSLYHHVYDVDNLRACYEALPKDRAVGVDGVTKEEYGKNLEENLRQLHEELKTDTYQPLPVKQKLIPKPGKPGKFRPLGIPTLRQKYGGKKNRGHNPDQKRGGSGSVLRKALQQLEKAGLIAKTKEGRILTPKGVSFMDGISHKVAGAKK